MLASSSDVLLWFFVRFLLGIFIIVRVHVDRCLETSQLLASNSQMLATHRHNNVFLVMFFDSGPIAIGSRKRTANVGLSIIVICERESLVGGNGHYGLHGPTQSVPCCVSIDLKCKTQYPCLIYRQEMKQSLKPGHKMSNCDVPRCPLLQWRRFGLRFCNHGGADRRRRRPADGRQTWIISLAR